MSKRDSSDVLPIIIVIAKTKKRIGRYEARLDGDDRVLCVSATPFFDAARKLLSEGYDSRATLVMRHSGSDTESLRGKLGIAATLTVEETDYGPRFRRWKAFSALAVAPWIASPMQGATCTPALPSNDPQDRGRE